MTTVVPLRRNRDFQALWISRFLAGVGKEAAEVAYPLLILAMTGSASYAGAVGAMQLVTAMLTSVPGGVLADRLDRRRLLIGCDLLRLVLLAAFATLILLDRAGLPLVFAIVIASSAALGASNPVAFAAIKQVVPASQLTSATAQNQIRLFGGTVVGPPIGGPLFGIARALPFFAVAFLFLCSTVLLLLIRRPLQAIDGPKQHPRGWLAGFPVIARQPILRNLLMWITGSNMAFNHTGAFLALIATAEARGGSGFIIGLTLSIAGAGGMLGALVAAWVVRWSRPGPVILAAAWVGPVAAVLLATVPGVLPLGIILACVFVRAPITNALFFGYVAALVPDELQGRVLGSVMAMSLFAQPLGILAIGIIFDVGGAAWVFVFMGTIAGAAALPTLSRLVRRLPRPEQLS